MYQLPLSAYQISDDSSGLTFSANFLSRILAIATDSSYYFIMLNA